MVGWVENEVGSSKHQCDRLGLQVIQDGYALAGSGAQLRVMCCMRAGLQVPFGERALEASQDYARAVRTLRSDTSKSAKRNQNSFYNIS